MQSDISLSRRSRPVSSLLLGCAFLLGLAAEAEAQVLSLPNPSGIGSSPNERYVDLHYLINVPITPFTLSEAIDTTGPNDRLEYSITESYEPWGLTFDPDSRSFSGTPTIAGAGLHPNNFGYPTMYRAHDPVTGNTISQQLFIVVCERAGFPPPSPSGLVFCRAEPYVRLAASPPDLIWPINVPITPFTLPEATGGTGTNPVRFHEVRGTLPAGLSYDSATRILTGTPTELEEQSLVYELTEFGTIRQEIENFPFDIRVTDQVILPQPAEQALTLSIASPLTLPAVTNPGPHTYTLTGTPFGAADNPLLPGGLTFDSDSRSIVGTPTESGGFDLSYTAIRTEDGASATVTVRLVVSEPSITPPPEDQTYTAGTAIAPLTLPEATPGIGAFTYALTGLGGAADTLLPEGLTFDPATRELTGTPTLALAVPGEPNVTYTATDENGNTARATFRIIVTVGMSFPTNQPGSFSRQPNVPLDPPVTLPEASGGIGAVTYRLAQRDPQFNNFPEGLTFDPETRELAGTPTVSANRTRMRYSATDSRGNVLVAEFLIAIAGPILPAIPTSIPPSIRPYNVGRAFTYTLPERMDIASDTTGFRTGDPPYTYSMFAEGGDADNPMLPEGLTFDGDSRILSSTPQRVGTTTLVYRITDSMGRADQLELLLTISAARFDRGNLQGLLFAVNRPSNSQLRPIRDGEGIAPFTYALFGPGGSPSDPRLPPGLSFDGAPDQRRVVGIPTETGITPLTYMVTDANGNITLGHFDGRVGPAPDFPPGFRFPDQTYTLNAPIVTLTLPDAASGGLSTNADYFLFGPEGSRGDERLPPGLAYDRATRTVSGTPTALGTTVVSYEARDLAENSDTTTFNITVVSPPTFQSGVPADQTFTAEVAITALTMPEAVLGGGSGGTLVYSLFGPGGDATDRRLPAGLTYADATRVLSGTPTALGTTELTYTATDNDADEATNTGMTMTTFSVTVVTGPAFPVVRPSDQLFPVNLPITAMTLPQVSSAGTPEYALTGPGGNADDPSLPAGLTFDATARVLSGTPTAFGATTLTYTATDQDGAVRLTFRVTVVGPVFEEPLPDLTFEVGTPLVEMTLPRAITDPPGYRPLFTLTGPNGMDLSEAPGLSFNARHRLLTGTPNRAGMTTLTYTTTDESGNGGAVSTTFTVTFTSPVFPELVPDQVYANHRIAPLTLPQVTVGTGNPVYTLFGPGGTTATPMLPAGLTFDPATRTLFGSPTAAAAGETTLTYTANDIDLNRDLGSMIFKVDVVLLPTFASSQMVADQTWDEGEEITPLTLPQATGGSGTLFYRLDPATSGGGQPKGLVFDPVTRTLSGTPLGAAGSYHLYYYALDDRNLQPVSTSGGVPFTVTINNRPYFSDVVADQAYRLGPVLRPPLTLPQAGGGVGDLTYTLTGPDGAALPNLISFDPATRIVSGDPVEAFVTELTYTASDTLTPEPGTVSQTFTMTFIAGGFFRAEDRVPDQGYVIGTAIDPPLTLPTAISSASPLHTLRGPGGTDADFMLPPGLSYDAQVLSGMPTEAGVTELIYTALIAGVNPSLTFSVTVRADGENTAPTANADADRTVVIMPREVKEVDLSPYFADPDGDPLTYTAVVADDDQEDVKVVEPIDGAMMTLIADATIREEDPATITVTATDSFGTTAELEFTVIIVRPPTLYRALWNVMLDTGEPQTYRELNPERATLFDHYRLSSRTAEPMFRFEVSSSDSNVVSASLSNSGVSNTAPTFMLTPRRMGDAIITVRAYDQRDMSAVPETATFTATNRVAVAGGVGFDDLNAAILPEIARAMADSTVSAIARRVEQANSAPATSARIRFGGQDTLAGALTTHGQAMTDGSRGFKELLSGSGFVLPLNVGGGAGAGVSSASLWGSGEYRDLSGESGSLDWDGDLSGVHLGVDARLGEDVLGGVAVSWLESDLEYGDDGTGDFNEGEMVVDLTSVYPYIGWRAGGLDMWASAGYGEGEQEITEQGQAKVSSDINLRTFAVGGSGRLWDDGTTRVRLKGEAMQTELEVEGSAEITELTVDATRVRVTLEASQTRALADGGVFEPSLEVGVRDDGGDGETGTGAEIGGALRYHNPATGLTAEGRIRALLRHGGEYEEWGISGSLHRLPGADGQGLSFSLSPGYGNSSGGGLQELWRQGVSAEEDNEDATDDYHARMDARLGYGFSSRRYNGVLTPYTELTLGATDRYRLGMNWKPGPRLDLTLLGERSEGSSDPAEHRLLLKGEVWF